MKFLINEISCSTHRTLIKRKAKAAWWKNRGGRGGGAWPWRQGQRWMVTGKCSDARVGCSGPLSVPVSFDKDPETHATQTLSRRNMWPNGTKRDNVGSEGIIYRRVRLCVLPCSLVLVFCVQCRDLEPLCARDIGPRPLQLLRYIHTRSVPTPSVTHACYKTCAPSKRAAFHPQLVYV